ncbi:MAG: hypothetical protein AAFZ05_14795, partial [Pseudomonadota bacterium]
MLAAEAEHSTDPWVAVLSDVALCRTAPAGGATRAEIARDLTPLVSHRLSPSEFRTALDDTLAALIGRHAITEARGRCHLTDLGTSWLSDWLNCKGLPKDWADIRDVFLTARALGQHDMPLTRRKLLAKPDGLRMAILQNAYGIKLRQTPSLARMRAALAGIALKRAFGNKLAPGFSTDGGVDANSSRLLAGELARKPRDFETDGKLIAALAAEAVHAAQADVGTLRLTILRAYFSRAAGPTASEQPVTAPPRMAARTAKPPADGKAPQANATANLAKATTTGRPDLEAFSTAVLAAGEARA